MKKIHIIRHAKSSWKDKSLEDIERPLNKRGVKTCEFMAEPVYRAGCCFDHVYCSPAVRAQLTIELISKNLPDLFFHWQIEKELYTFDHQGLIQWFRSVDENISEILIIGHNPALTDLSNTLGDRSIKNIPTCGYVQLVARKDFLWNEITRGSFETRTMLWPKKLRGQ